VSVAGEQETARAAQPRLRSDAQQNRDDLLAAAVRALTKDANASLDGIARAAGVGIGTLYRHYPTREALVEAAYRNKIRKLCDAAPELLKKHRPDVALARFLDRFIDDMLTKRGMIEAMLAVIAGGGTPLNQSLAMISAAVAPLIEAGKAEGVLRDDVTVDDFITIKGAVVFAGPAKGRRLAAILLDGLRYRARVPELRDEKKKTRKAARRAATFSNGPSASSLTRGFSRSKRR
jgi:AcrR family transcriptional regulator